MQTNPPLFEIKVVKVSDALATNVGRPTPLGNPFIMRKESERDSVCDYYDRWFNDKISDQDPIVLNELRKLWLLGKQQGYLYLGCYCAPRRCHADTIARFLKHYT
jgi:hypothetical protein